MTAKAWAVTYDHLDDVPVLVVGPSDTEYSELEHCNIKFRMRDDDGNLYYSGVMDELYKHEDTGCDPLMAYGMPNAGCTSLEIMNDKGEWEGWIS